MATGLRIISAEEFARRLGASTINDHRFAFFIGAGCSKSSGIPTAGELVADRWLPRLRSLCEPAGGDQDLSTWANSRFPSYDQNEPAVSYGPVMEQLFLHPGERQAEIEALCEGRFPRFGYATLASLVAHESGRFNVVLTTNFDDLIADALYLFTPSRPLVIQHAALSEYIRPTRTRPLVVKVHGDYQLAPLNTAEETKELADSIERAVQSLLHDRGLIVVGYGGGDRGILRMLDTLSAQALPFGVYWVSRKEPRGAVRAWLDSRNAVWVEYADFDKFMVLFRSAFNLPKPDEDRFKEVFRRYADDYVDLAGEIRALSDVTAGAAALKEAVNQTDSTFQGSWSAVLEANRLSEADPDQADASYRRGIDEFPDFPPLLASYAVFLHTVRKDYDRAEDFYKRAIAADANYAASLGAYAVLLQNVRKDYDQAEEFFKRAIAVDPNDTDILSSYAVFLQSIRRDDDQAEEFHRRAIAANSDDINSLGNYIGFLLAVGKNQEGLSSLGRIWSLPQLKNEQMLLTELLFYGFAHGDADDRLKHLRDLRHLLESGVRSPGWDLSRNIDRACADEHPDCAWLERLAAVVADEADLTSLSDWSTWREAEDSGDASLSSERQPVPSRESSAVPKKRGPARAIPEDRDSSRPQRASTTGDSAKRTGRIEPVE
jgi:Tfp pilus assembly protein PilF